MAKVHRILNTTKGCYLKWNQALSAIDSCSATWLIEGVSIRNLTLSEAIAARNAQAQQREILPAAELKNVVFRFPPTAHYTKRDRNSLIQQANNFVANQ